jgi:predicted AAA+ superfamily ATPase
VINTRPIIALVAAIAAGRIAEQMEKNRMNFRLFHKTYFTDLGIRNALIGLTSIAQMERLNQLGVTLENAVVNRIVQRMVFAKETVSLHYWRTKTKEEVDLVIVTPERLLPIEIKSDKNIQARHLRGLRHFFAKEKERTGILIGRFDSVDLIEDGEKRICLLPFWML